MPVERRNIVVFLCDQLRPDFLSVYGCRGVPTPNLDRLAREGVVFDHAITQSTVCAPARACMMTGRYVSDHGVWTNDVPFRDGLEYLPDRMNLLGYSTGAFGKLHHFPPDDPKGFRHVRQMEESRLGEREPYLQWLRERHPEVTSVWNTRDNTFLYPEEEYYEHWIASEAMEFIAGAAREGSPFLSWISFQGPHGPFDPPREVQGTCDPEALPAPLERMEDHPLLATALYRSVREWAPPPDAVRALRVAYAEMIVAIDRQVGRVLEHLEALGVREQTTILFSADHGDLLWDFGLTAKGPFPYQGQLAIPMLVSNHPALTPGTRSGSLVGNIDLPGTVLDIAGDDRPLGVSRSLLDQAQPRPRHPREVNFSEFCDSIKTVEDGRYCYSYYPFTDRAELYDRQEDPNELVNLAGRPEVAAIERRFLKHVVDLGVLARGTRVEAHDLVPDQQEGLRRKHPGFERDFPIAFPLNRAEVERLEKAGLDTGFNEFCKGKPIQSIYGKPYWEE